MGVGGHGCLVAGARPAESLQRGAAATAPGMQSGGMPHARGFGRDSALWLAGYVRGKWEGNGPVCRVP